jgi:multiple sugar transport system substrate-binding protein
MRVELYNMMMSRRNMLKGTTALAAAAATGTLTALPNAAMAADDLRSQILAIPGVGKGQWVACALMQQRQA